MTRSQTPEQDQNTQPNTQPDIDSPAVRLFKKITHDGRKVKLPLLATFMTLAILITSWFSVLDMTERMSHFDQEEDTVHAVVTHDFNMQMQAEANALQVAIASITGTGKLGGLFVEQDSQALQTALQPVFQDLNTLNDISHMQLSDSDRRSFMHLHGRSMHAAVLSHHTLEQAFITKSPSIGLEMNDMDALTLEVVVPWRLDGEVIGFIEMGKDITPVIAAIEEEHGVQLIELVRKSMINQAAWDVGVSQPDHRQAGRHKEWQYQETYIPIKFGSMEDANPAMISLATKENPAGPISYWYEDQYISSSVLDIESSKGDAFVKLIINRDMTTARKAMEAELLNDILVAIIIIAVILIVTWKLVGLIQAQIEQTQHQLEMMVNTKTIQLANTSKALAQETEERSKAEVQSAFFGRILEDSWNEIYIFSAKDFHFLHVNRGALSNIGFSMEEMSHKTAHDIKPEFSKERFSEAVNPLLTGEVAFLVFEASHQRKDGTVYPVEVRLQYLAAEKPPVFVAVINDISARKQAEHKILELNETLEKRVEDRTRQLKETQSTLVESEKMASLGSLVAGVSHEINTPVGIGVTASTHLTEEVKKLQTAYEKGTITEEDMERFLQVAHEASRIIEQNLFRASELIRSFKMVAVDQHSEETRKVNLKDYVGDVLVSLRPQIRKKSCLINFICDDDMDIETYPGAIAQIVTNLVTNAISHAFDKDHTAVGEMWLEITHSANGILHLTFRDNGKGVPPSLMGTVFDPFVTSKRGQGGTGLGLHILHNLVTQKLGGTVACSNMEDGGARFDIEWPVSKGPQEFVPRVVATN